MDGEGTDRPRIPRGASREARIGLKSSRSLKPLFQELASKTSTSTWRTANLRSKSIMLTSDSLANQWTLSFVVVTFSSSSFFSWSTMVSQRYTITTASLLVLAAALGLDSSNALTPDHSSQRPAQKDAAISRRSALILGGAFGLSSFLPPAQAADDSIAMARSKLMDSIKSNKSEQEVMKIIDQVVALDPAQGRGATLSEDLSGEWKLVWSAKADGFSPLLKLPKPFKPDSYQYLGGPAAEEVGAGRVAQGLTGGVLGAAQFWLSSGVAPSSQDPSVLDILPPFRFEVGGRYQSGKPKSTIVEAGSDADFRKVNVRTQAAQQAPKNEYQQLYLERNGPGSIRISTVREGDPVIVGAIFVHQKM